MTIFTTSCLEGMLQDARKGISSGCWTKASEDLTCIMYITEKMSLEEAGCTKDAAVLSREGCAQLLLECGRIWNQLMQMSQAVKCFRLALKLLSSKQPATTKGKQVVSSVTSREEDPSVIVYAWMQTYLLDKKPDRASQLCHEHFSWLSCAKTDVDTPDCCKEQMLMLDVAEALGAAGQHSKAVHALTLLCRVESRQSSQESLVVRARRETILVRAKAAGRGKIPGDSSDFRSLWDMYQDALVVWERANWPLEHAETIITTMGAQALEKLDEGACPTLDLMLALYDRLWTRCGYSTLVGKQMFEVLRASCKKKFLSKVSLYGKQAVGILQNCAEVNDADRTSLLGLILCLVAPSFAHDASVAKAADHFQSCISSLESTSTTKKRTHRALAASYLCLTFVRKIFPVPLDEVLYYTAKALARKERLTPSVTRSIQAIRGDALHRKASQLEQAGRVKEAEPLFHQADYMFSQTIQQQEESFEFIAYGYFLIQRHQYEAAEKTLLVGYLHSCQDHHCLSFTRSKSEILSEELKFEVQCSDTGCFSVPNRAAALYFRIQALAKIGGCEEELARCVGDLEEFSRCYDFTQYTIGQQSVTQWRAASWSLLGYALRTLGQPLDSENAFREAFNCHNSEASRLNLETAAKH